MFRRFRKMENIDTQMDILTFAIECKKDGDQGLLFNGILKSISIEKLQYTHDQHMSLQQITLYQPPDREAYERF
jgi:hypothetical protein